MTAKATLKRWATTATLGLLLGACAHQESQAQKDLGADVGMTSEEPASLGETGSEASPGSETTAEEMAALTDSTSTEDQALKGEMEDLGAATPTESVVVTETPPMEAVSNEPSPSTDPMVVAEAPP